MVPDEEAEDSPTGAPERPEDHEDAHDQSLASYATIVGIVTGLFGMLLGVGFILLPSATMREKVLVIGACLSISVAGLTGVGAWASPRRFGLTMLAGGLAIVCLADLSIEAADVVKAASLVSTHQNSPKTPGPTSGSSKTVGSKVGLTERSNDTRKKPPVPEQTGTLFLSGQTGTPALSANQSGPVSGPQIIGGVRYGYSLGYSRMCLSKTNSITYDLDKSYSDFHAEVGIADGWGPGDQTETIHFTVDSATRTGEFSRPHETSASTGHPSKLDVPIPPGTKTLRLTTTIPEGCVVGTIAWGNPRLTS